MLESHGRGVEHDPLRRGEVQQDARPGNQARTLSAQEKSQIDSLLTPLGEAIQKNAEVKPAEAPQDTTEAAPQHQVEANDLGEAPNPFQRPAGSRSEAEQRMIAESNAKAPPKPKNDLEMSEAIVHVLGKYRMINNIQDPTNWPAKELFVKQTLKYVQNKEEVKMILPAFPFKSPNKRVKVLGTMPDASEELSLHHLNGMCAAVKDVYGPGAKICLISDGLMYNDILGISEEEVWNYGQALRDMAHDANLPHLEFLRLHEVKAKKTRRVSVSQEEYLRDAAQLRQETVDQYLPANFDVSEEAQKNEDLAMTYRGYIKFLEHDRDTAGSTDSKSQIKKQNEEIARKMVRRGKAYGNAIKDVFPEHIRLSIHPSTETEKLSIDILPQVGFSQTPWHSSLVRDLDGTVTTSHHRDVDPRTHELIFKNGQPSYFRERSELFNWGAMDVDFDYMYPCGIMIRPKNKESKYSLKDVDMQKVRLLSIQCSPIVLRGFQDTTNEEVYVNKAYQAGEPAGWTFGIKTSVKDSRGNNNDPVTAIVTSSEAMPMHFDGFFFLVDKEMPDGTIKKVSSQPHFQYFSAITKATSGSGYTLFASSPLLWRYLPHPYTADDFTGITWDCRHSSNWDEHMNRMPLVRTHPETGENCLRYHEPWPQWKTKFTYNRISIENGPQEYIDLLDEMLYDRRVTIWYEWEQGDVLVSDNIKMLHTRTAFSGTEDRELWRIHFN